MSAVIDNKAHHRFELEEGGYIAFADYQRRNGIVTIPHVEAPMPLRGTGAAGRLMEGLLGLIRADGEKLRAICPYALAYVAKNKQHQDLLA